MKDRIFILRENVIALASRARSLKSEADEANKRAVLEALESAEDFLDYAVDKLKQAAEAVDAKEAF